MAKDHRQMLSDMFVKAIEEDGWNTWIKGWNFNSSTPINAVTKKPYHGSNKLYLQLVEIQQGFDDNRWMTSLQIKKNGYRIQKGAEGYPVEFCNYWELKSKTYWDSWEVAEFIRGDDKTKEKYFKKKKISFEINPDDMYFRNNVKRSIVFNAEQIDGIPDLDFTNVVKPDIEESELLKDISEALGVKIIELAQNDAYYNYKNDKIVLPLRSWFKSNQAYNRTALHELSHSTGHESRLNRNLKNSFGSEAYAYEELVAEISSAFMGEFISDPVTDDILNNHKAYIKSWSEAIKNDKDFIIKAIKDAEKAADYMINKAQLERFHILEAEDELDDKKSLNITAAKEIAKKNAADSSLNENKLAKRQAEHKHTI